MAYIKKPEKKKMKEEIWKPIIGFEGKYEISNLGRVKSLRRKVNNRFINEKILSITKIKNYLYVNLSYNCKCKQVLLHRLIAKAFIPNPDNKQTVNHINQNTLDNRIENLEWATMSEQYDDLWHKKMFSLRNNKKYSKPIIQYDLNGNYIKEWPSIIEIERQLGYSHSDIIRCSKGVLKKAYNYIWKYKDANYKQDKEET